MNAAMRTLTIPAGMVFVIAAGMSAPLWLGAESLDTVALASIYALLALSLGSLMRFTGQLSLAHGAFAAIGAYVMGVGTVDHHLNFFLTVGIGVAAAAAVGYVLARPLARLTGFYLIIATLGFSEVVTILASSTLSRYTHGVQGLYGIERPSLFGLSLTPGRRMFWFGWGVVVVLSLLIDWFASRTAMGLALRASSADAVGAKSFGFRVNVSHAIVFGVTAAMAAVAGVLLAVNTTTIDPNSFGVGLSVTVFTMIVVGGPQSSVGPVIAALFLTYLPNTIGWVGVYQTPIEGLIIIVVLLLRPNGLVRWSWFGSGQGSSLMAAAPTDVQPAVEPRRVEPAPPSRLEAHDLTVSFGGVKALENLSVELVAGQVTGIMGPNGAGKTTLLNALSGLVRTDSGGVVLDGRRIRRPTPEAMVRAGVVRTYQAPRLFGQLDARENVLCGTYWRERATAGVGIEQMSVHDIMRLTRTDRLWSRDRRENLQLTFGMSRLIEIARVLLTNPRFVLLDEPAAGLDPDEADVLREIIGVLRDRGIGVALIEHDVPFLLEMADTVTVMNMGTVLLTGSADAVRSDSRVQQIYLGRADAAL